MSNKEELYVQLWNAKLSLNKIAEIIDMCDDDSSPEMLMLALSTIRLIIMESTNK